MIKYAKGLQNITTVQGRRRTSTSTRASSALKCQNNVATATGWWSADCRLRRVSLDKSTSQRDKKAQNKFANFGKRSVSSDRI